MFDLNTIYKYLYLDVETAPLYSSLESLSIENPRLSSLWEKRCVYYKGAFSNLAEASNEEIYKQKSSLEPEFSKVVCVSFGTFDDYGIENFRSFYGDDENDILTKCAKVLANAYANGMKLCGHNIKGFDIPCLGKRMIYNGIKPPSNISVWDKKPWELPHIDTSDIFAFGSFTHQKYLSLDLLACSLGIKSPKENIDGSKVGDIFWIEKGYNTIKEYCEMDVKTVMDVMLKLCF